MDAQIDADKPCTKNAKSILSHWNYPGILQLDLSVNTIFGSPLELCFACLPLVYVYISLTRGTKIRIW